MMNWISISFFAIGFLIFCSMLKKNADIISPARIFGLAWCVVFGLANLKFSKLQFTWDYTQWMLVLMGPISFLIGLYSIYVINLGSQLLPLCEIRKKVMFQQINSKKLFYLIIFAFFIYLSGYFVIYLVKGYIPIFTLRPAAARGEYFIFGVGLFPHTMAVIIYFSVIYHLFTEDNIVRKRIIKAIMLITLVTYLFLLQRYQLIMVAVLAFSVLYYTTRHIRLRTMLIFILLGIILIYSVATLRSGKIIQLALYVTSQMKFSPDYAIFTEPYMYIVMNVENFVHSVSKLEQFTFGYYTFNFALALTGLKHWIEGYYGIVDTPFLFSGYNTYTFFWTFYRDFGILGISFIPLILGLFVGSLYYTIRRHPTIELITYYCIIVFMMMMSFFVNLLGFLWFVYIIVWIVLIFRFIRINTHSSVCS